MPGTAAQQAFISLVAPGAIAAEQRYGIPAAVTIAQAIDESGWGQSVLATADHNLFGIKGTGPAGTDMLPTREHENGVWVTRTWYVNVVHPRRSLLTGMTRDGTFLIENGEVHVTPQGRHVGRYILAPGAWWMPPPAALLMQFVTVWLLPPPLRAGFGYDWGPRRERLTETLAALSRIVVPRLPHLMRDLPLARAADRRVRGVAWQAHAARERRRSGSTDGARRASSARPRDLW